MTLLNIIRFHPLRDTLPDGTEVRLVLPVERTNNKPLYVTSDGRPFSHVRVKDKTTGDYRFEYHPLKPIFDTSKTNRFNGHRKQKYLKMTRTYGYILIHHAVYLAWSGQRIPLYHQIHHLTGITTDNLVDNLLCVHVREHSSVADVRQRALKAIVPDGDLLACFTYARLRELQDPRTLSDTEFQRELALIRDQGFHISSFDQMEYEMTHHMEV